MKFLFAYDCFHRHFLSEIIRAKAVVGEENCIIPTYHYNGKINWEATGKYDVGFGLYYQHKIPAEQLNIPWINIHPGILPMYAGRNISYHLIMNDEKEAGISAHFMSENYDAGDIIRIDKFPINGWMTAGDISNQCLRLAKLLFLDIIDDIVKTGKLPNGYPQNKNKRNYYPKEKINDIIQLNKEQEKQIRAVTVPGKFYPKILINDREYLIKPKGEL